MPRKRPSPFPEPAPLPTGDAVDWTVVQRSTAAGSNMGSVVCGHIALQLVGKNAPASEVLMAQLIVEIAALREAIASKA